ncbi:MAG: triacylglycerol lipase [Firmicutes bacterium]|nr:triacylglycerol lipase [Bacillota bacterium]
MKKKKTKERAKEKAIDSALGVFIGLLAAAFGCLRGVIDGGVYLLFLWVFIIGYILVNALPMVFSLKIPTLRLKVCRHGVICLKGFITALILSAGAHVYFAAVLIPDKWQELLWSGLVCFVTLFVLFWNGMISVYAASVQLGVRKRLAGLMMGLVPVLNLIMLRRIISVVSEEIYFEKEKIELNESRKAESICQTKYPILFVHGVFFRDFKYLNYWGRIPEEIIKNGGKVYYGNHQSAASVKDCGEEIAARIRGVTAESGCPKVNIIAHSKGGLDSRYAIANCGVEDMVASLTTVNTPHRGCIFAEYLLTKLPQKMQQSVALTYNTAAAKLGDQAPDFMAAVSDLRADKCGKYDQELTVPDTVYKQSVGSLLKYAAGGRFPLNFTYNMVKYFDGPNDGLVSEPAFKYGEKYTLITPTGMRGISHGDMIDLNRENIKGFDVREFYVQLVKELKDKGL